MDNKTKLKAFFENTKRLNKHLGINPLLYGSLGLEYAIGADISVDDIDILIPEYHLHDGWSKFRRYLETLGYVLTDEHEHTFEKNGISYSYASIENLLPFAGIKLSDIETVKSGEVRFMLLSPEQYLAVYEASAGDGYRLNVKEKKDNEKIDLIKEFLENRKRKTAKRKKLKIKHFCRMTPFANIVTVLMVTFLGLMTVLAFAWKSYEIAALLSVILFIAFVGLGFFWNYGLTVSNKYVTVLYFNEIRLFSYDEVTKIELWVDDDVIVGSIKAKGQKEYDVCFADFNICLSEILFPKLWDVKVKISDEKMKKIKNDSIIYEIIKIHYQTEMKGRK